MLQGARPAPPASVNYLKGMPADLGVMMNGPSSDNPPGSPDGLGDCTCAACGHALQIWSFNALGAMDHIPDKAIEGLYETQGYVPGEPWTDNGANEQSVLTQWLKGGLDGNKLAAFVEIGTENSLNLKSAIWECGVVYNGFNVPAYLQDLEAPGSVWDVPGSSGISASADTTILGGHCTLWPGYAPDGQNIMWTVQSWGYTYYMTPAFVAAYVDEAYCLADALWLTKTGYTVAGKTLTQLEQLMQLLKS